MKEPLRNIYRLMLILAVRSLSELVAQVKDEQGYIIMRERTHRNTAESTNARVKWWSIFQMCILAGEGIFQVWWLKRFFEVSFHLALQGQTLPNTLPGEARRVITTQNSAFQDFSKYVPRDEI